MDNMFVGPMVGEGYDPFGLAFDEESYSLNDDSSESPIGTTNKGIQFSNDSVSCFNKCYTREARQLCILDLSIKLNIGDHYDIGGTCNNVIKEMNTELWFYCTTSICPQGSFILNILFSNRQEDSVSIGISDTNEIIKKSIYDEDTILTHLTLPDSLCWKTFKCNKLNESHHVKSYCFSKEDSRRLNKQVLSIPIKIEIHKGSVVDRGLLLRIKNSHKMSELFKRQENTDYTLQSTSGKKYDVHKLLLATHSSVLRNILKNSNLDSLSLSIDDIGMEQFLEYIYTGTVKNISQHNWGQLLELANKFNLDNLHSKTEKAITQQICVNNAIDMVVLSEKYKMATVQKAVFEFIKCHPNVLETEGWNNLNDIDLTKKLFKEMSIANCPL